MAHAKESDLIDLDYLLKELRTNLVIKEKSFGCFYMKGKGVLHFHTKDQRLYAHVFDGKEWQEVDIPSSPSMTLQKKILKMIQNILESKV